MNVTSQQKRKRNRTSSTDSSKSSMTRNLSRNCSHSTCRQQQPRCSKCAKHIATSDKPQGHGIEGTEDSKCHKEAKQTMTWQETSCRQCALKSTHLADHHAQHRMTYARDVERRDTGSPNAEVDIKDPRTRCLNTTTEEEDRRRSMKFELMKTPIVMKSVLLHLFSRHHLTQNDSLPDTRGVELILIQLRYLMFR